MFLFGFKIFLNKKTFQNKKTYIQKNESDIQKCLK